MTASRLVRSALCAALLAAIAVPATAAWTDPPPHRVRTSAGVVHIEPAMHAPAWQLRVSGPDGRIGEDTLLDDEPLRIEPKLLGYPRWLDGTYQYELAPVLGDRQRGDAVAAQAPSKASVPGPRGGGSFVVKDGVVILAGGKEPASRRAAATAAGGGTVQPADVVNADDVIVQGSLCVGFDCVNNESFGFDTIRMKENNLQIAFDDTSTSAGFPNNDWRLQANDTVSGGVNRFMIVDATLNRPIVSVEAGAPANNLYVDSTGNIGFGTTTPALDLHLTTTDTPATRYEQTNGGGFTAQTWDIGANEANFFVRDVTGGSRLSLRIRPGAPTSSVDIAASGNVGMGIQSPAAALHVARGSGPVGLRLGRTAGTAATLATWEILNNQDTGRLTFSDDPALLRVPMKLGRNAVDNLLRVGVVNASTVDVNGNLKVTGNIQVTGSVGPDYVFAPGFALPSIGEHAEQMWRDRHLPKVGPARVEDGQGVIDLGAISHGMLEELEYAHVYIAQLDGSVRQLQAELAARDAQLAQVRAEIEAIKAALPRR